MKMENPRPHARLPGTNKRNPAYSKWYYKQNKDNILRKNREYNMKNKVSIMKARARYRERPERRRKTNLKQMMGTRARRRRKPGLLYFFKSVTPGFYKVGCTVNWENRKRYYGGPNSIEKIHLMRPVPDMFRAESMLKMFLCEHGYERYKTWGDWLVKRDELVFNLN